MTLDDATSEHCSTFFVEEEGTASSFRAMVGVIETRGLPSSLYTDRDSHYWTTSEAGGKVDREHRTQFGRAMRQLGVEMLPAYSPRAREGGWAPSGRVGAMDHIMYARRSSEPGKPGRALRPVTAGGHRRGRIAAVASCALGWRIGA